MFGGSLENFSVLLDKCLFYQGKGAGGPLGQGRGSGPMVQGGELHGIEVDRAAQSPGGQFLGSVFLSAYAWSCTRCTGSDRIEGDRRRSKAIEGATISEISDRRLELHGLGQKLSRYFQSSPRAN